MSSNSFEAVIFSMRDDICWIWQNLLPIQRSMELLDLEPVLLLHHLPYIEKWFFHLFAALDHLHQLDCLIGKVVQVRVSRKLHGILMIFPNYNFIMENYLTFKTGYYFRK